MADELAGKDEQKLIRRAQEGDTEAIQELTLASLPLIRALSSRFFIPGGMFSRDDLVDAGVLGLIQAIQRFSFETGAAFRTYCVHWILGEMRLAVRKAIDSTGVYPFRRRIRLEQDRLLIKLGRMPALDELAEALGLSVGQAAELVAICASGIDAHEDGAFSQRDVSLQQMKNDLEAAELRMAMDTLPQEEKKLIMIRYFRDMTQKEAAVLLGKSQSQISKIENRALDRLRVQLN